MLSNFFKYGAPLFFLFVLAAPVNAQTPQSKDSLAKIQKQKTIEEKQKQQQQQGVYQKPDPVQEPNKGEKKVIPTDNDIRTHIDSPVPFMADSLDSYIKRGMQQWEIPGLAIVVVKDGKAVIMKGYGVREAGKDDKVNEQTLFIIASNSKLFTGTSLAKLDFERKLSLNDKVTKYIPWFKLYDNTSTNLATIRDMLCHRIGLKTFQGDFTFWDSNLPKDSIVWKMRYLKPSGEFRQDYGYCNSGFLVAGQVLERVTGRSWENYVRENILVPLDMSQTLMNTAGLANQKNVAAPHNNLYGPLTKLPFDNVDNLGPATSMVSNVQDLYKWLVFQLDSGRYNGRRVLPWEVLQKTRDINILTGSRKSAAYPTHFRGYGLGLYSTDYNGRQVYWHTGGAFGHVTNVCFVPEENLGIAILTNNDNQSFFEALRYQVLDAYLGVNYTDRSKYQWGFFEQAKNNTEGELEKLQSRVAKKNKPELSLDAFTGEYVNTVYGKISISKGSNNTLVCSFSNHPSLTGTLEYMDNNEFRLTYSNIGYGIHPTQFLMKDGKVVSVEIRMNDFVEGDPYLFMKK